jgi:bifunctional non-homologous end joining protein LigD
LIPITHADKILFPAAHITKKDLISYYEYIAPVMLPYLRNRPLTLRRFVHGVTHEGFYQKNASGYFPAWIKRVALPTKTGSRTKYVVCNTMNTLLYLANQCTIEFHPWLSRFDHPHKPDRMIFDLDPSGKATFKLVVWTALLIRDYVKELGLPSFVMTTGSRGLHVVVPLKRVHTFDVVRACAQKIAYDIAQQYPQRLTTEMRIINRKNRVFIDILRNGLAQTGIAPYAVRAKQYAPVATPLAWEELSNRRLRSDTYTIQTMHRRISHVGDPWAGMQKEATSLLKVIKKMSSH